jgi:hypothetical protein
MVKYLIPTILAENLFLRIGQLPPFACLASPHGNLATVFGQRNSRRWALHEKKLLATGSLANNRELFLL